MRLFLLSYILLLSFSTTALSQICFSTHDEYVAQKDNLPDLLMTKELFLIGNAVLGSVNIALKIHYNESQKNYVVVGERWQINQHVEQTTVPTKNFCYKKEDKTLTVKLTNDAEFIISIIDSKKLKIHHPLMKIDVTRTDSAGYNKQVELVRQKKANFNRQSASGLN